MTPKKTAGPKKAAESIYLVDAHAYLHRAYHAMPPLTNKGGEPVGALFGFARMLMALVKREKPEYLAVCFDAPGPTFRHKEYKEYKATRKKLDDDLIVQLEAARGMVEAMNIPTVEIQGFEADDLLATLAKRGRSGGLRVVVVSGDKDALQLVDDRVRVLNEAKNTVYDADGVKQKFKVAPEQLADYLAILGDVSDNVPGVPGIGAVGAARLLQRFKSLDELIEAAKKKHPDIPPKAAQALADNAERALMSRRLITLEDEAPVALKPEECRYEIKPTERLIGMFQRFGFKSLLRELAPDAELPPSGTNGAKPKTGKLTLKPAEPGELLKTLRGAKRISVAIEKPLQPDLLHSSAPMAALSLEDGCTAVFADEDFSKHKDALARVLADGKVSKTGHDLKACIGILREAGMELAGIGDDSFLAAYCLDPSRGRYPFEGVLEHYAGLQTPSAEPAKALARKAAASRPLSEVLGGELKDKGLEKLYREVELPLLEVLADMEAEGVALDAPYLKKLSKEFEKAVSELKREIDKLAGVEMNLNSPKQLGEFLYDKLGLPVPHKTKKGGRSTDEEALRKLASKHPVPAKIIDYRELAKLKSTYIDALLEKMDPGTKRIHSRFNQAGTATGRLSSLEPNLQNIPIRSAHGRRIRKAFVAGKGRVLLSADYSQIDLRALAHLSEDETLCEAFERDEDIHRKTASEIFGVPPAGVDKEMRGRAKTVNFGIVYGQTPHGLSQELGIPLKEAADYIQRYLARYKGVAAWKERTLETARKEGCVRTLLDRVRYLPDINIRNFQARSYAERTAINTPIQGTSADIIKVAMINIHRKMSETKKWKARMLLQVHDELVFELPSGEAKAFGAWVKREMEEAVKLRVPVVVDVKVGPNWQEMETLG